MRILGMLFLLLSASTIYAAPALFGAAPAASTASLVAAPAAPAQLKDAIFAGGCFWCVETAFEGLPGVKTVLSGYTGGTAVNPTYEQVTAGGTGHLEAVKVSYDPNAISYEKLVDVFWRSIDPTDAGGSFVDRGESYTSAIFVSKLYSTCLQ